MISGRSFMVGEVIYDNWTIHHLVQSNVYYLLIDGSNNTGQIELIIKLFH